MFLSRQFIREHSVSFAVLLFVTVYLILNTAKPAFLYDQHGSLRTFGLGYKNKTVIPMWLTVIALAILSYVFVLYYLVYPRIKY
jgi:hypothetical protein